jgi:hypothetical protein
MSVTRGYLIELAGNAGQNIHFEPDLFSSLVGGGRESVGTNWDRLQTTSGSTWDFKEERKAMIRRKNGV